MIELRCPDSMAQVDIYQLLAGHDMRTVAGVDEVIAVVQQHPEVFAQLIDGMRNEDASLRMRCADAAEKITRDRPELLTPYRKLLLNEISASPQQEVRWHVALMLPRLPLSAAQQRRAVAILTGYLSDSSRIVIVNSLQGLADIGTQSPVLRNEIGEILRSALAHPSPSVRARARKLTNSFQSPELPSRLNEIPT